MFRAIVERMSGETLGGFQRVRITMIVLLHRMNRKNKIHHAIEREGGLLCEERECDGERFEGSEVLFVSLFFMGKKKKM